MFIIHIYKKQLTLSRPGGHYGPPYYESVCRCCKFRATLTKLAYFFSFCYLPGPRKPSLVFVYQKIEKKYTVRILVGVEH